MCRLISTWLWVKDESGPWSLGIFSKAPVLNGLTQAMFRCLPTRAATSLAGAFPVSLPHFRKKQRLEKRMQRFSEMTINVIKYTPCRLSCHEFLEMLQVQLAALRKMFEDAGLAVAEKVWKTSLPNERTNRLTVNIPIIPGSQVCYPPGMFLTAGWCVLPSLSWAQGLK